MIQFWLAVHMLGSVAALIMFVVYAGMVMRQRKYARYLRRVVIKR